MIKFLHLILLVLITVIGSNAQDVSPLQFGNNSYYLKWLEPKINIKEVGKHEKLELGVIIMEGIGRKLNDFFDTGGNGLNPYNPNDISVEVTFVSPTYQERKVFGFYYQSFTRNGDAWEEKETKYNWRIRFSPDEIGKWTFSMKIITKDKTIETLHVKFVCVESKNNGVLRSRDNQGHSSKYMSLSETQESFFAIGHHVADSKDDQLTAEKGEQNKLKLSELADNGGNFFRLELGSHNALPDWNNFQNYVEKMPQMWEFDQLIEHAQNLGLYFMLSRQSDEIDGDESWNNNPYKTGFSLSSRKQYFINGDAIEWQNHMLRYIFSRWGYSTSFALYGYQEVDIWLRELQKETGSIDSKAISLFKNWFLHQKEYISSELGYNKLYVSTYSEIPEFEYSSKNDGMFANSNLIGFSGSYIDANAKYEKIALLSKNWNKPVLVEELCEIKNENMVSGTTSYSIGDFHNSIWASSFMGGAGTGINHCWDKSVNDDEYYDVYEAIAKFMEGENLNKEGYISQEWHERSKDENELIENYALISKNKKKAIGWSRYQYLNEEEKHIANQIFEIEGLESSSRFGKSNWYEVVFYSTASNQIVLKEIYKTTSGGKLELSFPESNDVANDFSYKITHLGESKKQPK